MTITFTTHRAKVSTRAAGRLALVSEQTADTDVLPTDETLVDHLGTMTTGWADYGTRRVAQFCRREGAYDYITEVEVR